VQLGLAGLGGLQAHEAQQLAALQGLGGAIGPYQGTQTTTQPIHRNPFLSALGGAVTGASLGGFGSYGGGAPAVDPQTAIQVSQMPGPAYGVWGF
jgi:hypothetical protein